MESQIQTDFCPRCEKEKEITEPREVILRKKCGQTTRILKGICPTCKGPIGKILPPIDEEEASKAKIQTIKY